MAVDARGSDKPMVGAIGEVGGGHRDGALEVGVFLLHPQLVGALEVVRTAVVHGTPPVAAHTQTQPCERLPVEACGKGRLVGRAELEG